MSALSPGQTVSHYRILRPLGTGGMGEVYLAEDTKLGRQVALKVLAHESARDPDRRARFEREARAIAALNHPNIITVYSVEEDQGVIVITMELVDGRTLADGIPPGGMSLDDLLKTAIPLTDAVGAAHQRGITHRDLKPANVMISHEGRVKVLDFGLAKHAAPDALQTETAVLPTAHATAEGKILGTVAYMSPEQAQGKPVDQRSDIFSLGIVLFEMATGRRPFEGDSNVSVLSSILKDRPPLLTDVRPEMPGKLARIVTRCLEKDPEERYQSAKDLRNDLKALKAESDSGELTRRSAPATTPPAPVTPPDSLRPVAVGPRHLRRLALTAAALALVAAAGAAIWQATSPPEPRVIATRQITSDGAVKAWPMTDGARVYFAIDQLRDRSGGGAVLAQVSATGGDTVPLPATRTDIYPLDIDASGTELLVMHSPGTTDADLTVRPIVGGNERPVGDIRTNSGIYGISATWTPDKSRVIYAKGSELRLAANDGSGSRTLLTAPGIPFSPRVSPDGQRLRYSVHDAKTGAYALWESNIDGSNPHPLLPGWTGASNPCCGAWTHDGRYYVFEANGNIWARLEAGGLFRRHAGDPVQLTFGPLRFTSVMPSRDGKRLFVVGDQPRGRLARYDPGTTRFVDYLGGLSAEGVVFSPDGASVAYTAFPGGTLWRSRLDGSERIQLTPTGVVLPRWSPDGSRIAFTGGTSNEDARIYIVPASGGASYRATSGKWAEFDPSWSLDGQTLLFGSNGGEAGISSGIIRTVDLKTGRMTTVPGSEGLFSPRWSPDRRFIVAMSLDSQRLALYDLSTQRWTDLVANANELGWPNWSPDGASVLFLSSAPGGRRIRRIVIATRHVEDVVDLAGTNQLSGAIGRWIGVTPDGWPMITLDAGSHDIYALDWDAP